MGKYHRKSIFAYLRSFRWWAVTYGSIKLVPGPLGHLIRTPPFSVLAFLAGLATGVWIVLEYVPCP